MTLHLKLLVLHVASQTMYSIQPEAYTNKYKTGNISELHLCEKADRQAAW